MTLFTVIFITLLGLVILYQKSEDGRE